MSSYPMSNNSWATKPVLAASSQAQHESQVLLPSSPPSPRQGNSSPKQSSPRPLSLIPQTQDVLQAQDSPEDLGRLISHKVDSIDDIRTGFQFAPHQAARSTASDMSRIKISKVSPVSNQQPVFAHPVPAPAARYHIESKRADNKNHTPTIRSSAPESLGNPTSLLPESRPSAKSDPTPELPIIGEESQVGGHQDENVGDNLASTLPVAEAIRTSIEQDDEQYAENPGVLDSIQDCHDKCGAKGQQLQQVFEFRKGQLLPNQMASSESQMPVLNQHSPQVAKRSVHDGNRQQNRLAVREAQLQQNQRDGIVTDLTFTAPGKPSSSPHHHHRPISSKNAQSKLPNRPLAKAKPNHPPLRPVSRESNISKRRMPTGQARTKAPSPHVKLKRQVNEHKKGLAYSWNGFFGLEHQYTEALECKIDNLKEGIEEYEYIVGQLRVENKTQAQTIENLTVDNGHLRKALGNGKEKIDEQTLKVQELSEKCREYKKHLNDAIVEQQHFYTKSKRNIQNIIEQLTIEQKAFEKSRDDTTSRLLQDSELAREALVTNMNKIVSEARQDTAELNKTIAVLRTELSERQRELLQERENTERIRSELGQSRHLDAETLQALTTQNTKILDAIEEGRRADQEALQMSKEQTSKLDSLVQFLEDLKSQVSGQTVVANEFAAARGDITKAVISEVQKLDSRVSDISQNELAVDIKIGEIMGLCQGIDECLKTNEGALHWQQKYQESDNQMREAISQRDTQIDAAQEAMKANQHFFDENTRLKSDVTSLERRVNELQAVRDAESAENDRLTRLLAGKDIYAKDLEAKLKESQATCKEQDDALGDAEVDRERLQQAIETANKQRDHSISEGIKKETRLLQEKQRDTERRLTVSDEARAKLEGELQHAKDQMHQLSIGEMDNMKKLLNEDIRRINHLIGCFSAVKVEMEGMGPISQWLDSRARLEDQHQILRRDFDSACHIKEKWAEIVSTDEAQIQLLRIHLQAGSETQAASGALPDRGPRASAVPFSEVAHARRVVVRSPVEEDIPLAPSVSEERENRRISQPLKSSIRVTRRASKELNKIAEETVTPSSASQEGPKKQKPELIIHSSFNRPVQGMHKRRQEELTTAVSMKRIRSSDLISKSTDQIRQTRSMSVGIRGSLGEEEEVCEHDVSKLMADGLAGRALPASEDTYGQQGPVEHDPSSNISSSTKRSRSTSPSSQRGT